jgi:DNA-binding HxlR family transcriptional regulator
MTTRRYGQYCAIAKALDVLGDRWALLIVRELLFGAMRYGELQAALPGVATDMLATRLRQLEAAGVIGRRPDDAKRYELRARGRELRPVLEALAVWGLGELSERTGDDAFDAKWLALPLGAMVRPDRAAGVTLRIRLVVDGDVLTVRLVDGNLDLSPPGGTADADVTIEGPPEALAAAITAPGSPAARRVEVRGDAGSVALLLYVLGLTDTEPGSA